MYIYIYIYISTISDQGPPCQWRAAAATALPSSPASSRPGVVNWVCGQRLLLIKVLTLTSHPVPSHCSTWDFQTVLFLPVCVMFLHVEGQDENPNQSLYCLVGRAPAQQAGGHGSKSHWRLCKSDSRLCSIPARSCGASEYLTQKRPPKKCEQFKLQRKMV